MNEIGHLLELLTEVLIIVVAVYRVNVTQHNELMQRIDDLEERLRLIENSFKAF